MKSTKLAPIPKLEGLYSACASGRIFSHRTNKYLSPRRLKNGYLRVCLINFDGTKKDYLIHRLVCAAFHGDNELQVNHIDADKSNNKPENLEWCSHIENMRHASRLGLLNKQSKRMKKMNIEKRSIPVSAFDKNGNLYKSYISMSDAEIDGFCHSKISLCISGKRKTHKGFTWGASVWQCR